MPRSLLALLGATLLALALHLPATHAAPPPPAVRVADFQSTQPKAAYDGWEKAATLQDGRLVIDGRGRGGVIIEHWARPLDLSALADGTLALTLTVLEGHTAEALDVTLMTPTDNARSRFTFPLEGLTAGTTVTLRAEGWRPLGGASLAGTPMPLGRIHMLHIQGRGPPNLRMRVAIHHVDAIAASPEMVPERERFAAESARRERQAAARTEREREARAARDARLASGRSDFVSLQPVTDAILCVHFDDGWVDHEPGIRDPRKLDDPSRVHQAFLNTTLADTTAAWRISSPDDPAFASPVTPTAVGRKSKGMDFLSRWRLDMFEQVVREHWVYLQLPTPLKPGRTYVLDLDHLARNSSRHTFTFAPLDPARGRSPTVHANQLGYAPSAPRKFAYLSQFMGTLGRLDLGTDASRRFHLVDVATGRSAFNGTISLRKDFETGGPDSGRPDGEEGPRNNWAGADLWECDFSTFNTPGEYVVAVEGIGCSFPFVISPHAYRDAYVTTGRGLFHNRAGTPLLPEHTRWHRPRNLHHEDGWTGLLPDGSRYTGWGWYQDAGDWDPYPHHSRVAVELLFAYELAPANFADGDFGIPESGNRIPDILDSAAWQVNYMRRSIGADGGVIARADFGERRSGPAQPSWRDTRKWEVWPETAANSFRFAAIAGQLAWCLDLSTGGRHADSAGLIRDAVTQYEWAVRRTASDNARLPALLADAESRPADRELRAQIREIRSTADHHAHAAAALYKATGLDRFQDDFRRLCTISDPGLPLRTVGNHPRTPRDDVTSTSRTSWDLRWAAWTYATIPASSPAHRNLDRDLHSRLIQASVGWADYELVDTARRRGFRVGLDWTVPHVNGQATAPDLLSAIVAHALSREERFLDVLHTSMDFFMGCNAANMLWVTGLGHQHPTQVLFLDQDFDDLAEPPPGIAPYGPRIEGDRGDAGFDGPWDNDCNRNSAFPSHKLWPINELYFENKYNPQGNEFTIHQSSAPWIAASGYLAGPATPNWRPNQAPSLTLATDTREASAGKPLRLSAAPVDRDGRTFEVRFLNGQQPIGTARQAPYTIEWTPPAPGVYTLSATAIDTRGSRTLSIDRPTLTITVR